MTTKVGIKSIKSHLQKARTDMLIERGRHGGAPGGAPQGLSETGGSIGDIHDLLAGAIRELRHFRS